MNVSERDNFIWLLSALTALLFSGAVLDQFFGGGGARVINLSITATLLVALWSLRRGARHTLTKAGISVLLAVIAIGDALLDDARLDLLALTLMLLFFLASIGVAARQILFTGVVDGNKIVGAIVIYLLIGLSWAFAYLLVEQLTPGALTGLTAPTWQDNLQTAIYYSFVTLTALGYGEITPALPITRFLAYMEAIVGQFYLAILVSSLIGARLSSTARQRHN